jgi:uncharacterized protein (UPF0332 family)
VKQLSNVDDCFRKGLLKQDKPQKDLALKDLRQAEFFLSETEDLLSEKKIMAAIALYNAFFHCARALLWKDGITERSHFCIARYIEENYLPELEKFLNSFETMMSIRHNVQYSTEPAEVEEDLEELHDLCEKFIEKVKMILGK